MSFKQHKNSILRVNHHIERFQKAFSSLKLVVKGQSISVHTLAQQEEDDSCFSRMSDSDDDLFNVTTTASDASALVSKWLEDSEEENDVDSGPELTPVASNATLTRVEGYVASNSSL